MHRNAAKSVRPPAMRQIERRALGVDEAKRLQLVAPKTERSRRTVPVPAQTLAPFRAHRRQQAADRLAAGERWQDHGLVSPSKVGTPMDPDHIDRTWHKIRAAVGLDWLRLHDLRHACATFLLVPGASPRTGHEGARAQPVELTMNSYGHVLPEIERAAVDEAAKRLFG
ncbi:tyrosine-type recombinase/integrase [Micromonospora psammae]|uniref:tyrosine-type recombinase/integrase n=1 Tax=Micromonospora sp. CPCC 205556 TaxID=3122398 RepID=UPI002FF08876